MKRYTTEPGCTLKRQDLKEGKVYVCSYARSGIVQIRCYFALIDGALMIHRAVLWEPGFDDVLNRREAFAPSDDVFPLALPCFKEVCDLIP